jgi:hypothetical protein
MDFRKRRKPDSVPIEKNFTWQGLPGIQQMRSAQFNLIRVWQPIKMDKKGR